MQVKDARVQQIVKSGNEQYYGIVSYLTQKQIWGIQIDSQCQILDGDRTRGRVFDCKAYGKLYNSIRMGVQNSASQASQACPGKFANFQLQCDTDQCNLDMSRLQKHVIELRTQQEIKYHQEIFRFRRKHAQRVATAYLFHDLSDECMCGMVDSICFFTDQSLSIPIRKGLQLIIECLQGLEILYNQLGGFEVSGSQIFFDQKNQLKVWISQNLAQVKPVYSVPEHHMIDLVFQIFDHSQPPNRTPSFYTDFLAGLRARSGKSAGFSEVREHMLAIKSQFLAKKTSLHIMKTLHIPATSLNMKNKSFFNLRSLKQTVEESEPKRHHCIGVQTEHSDHKVPIFAHTSQNKNTLKPFSVNIPFPVNNTLKPLSVNNTLKPLALRNALTPIASQNMIQSCSKSAALKTTAPLTESTKRDHKVEKWGQRLRQNCGQIPGQQPMPSKKACTYMLTELTTLKSIVYYSDMSLDSTIRVDLENYENSLKLM